jgi:hypothetical protein
MSDKNAGAAVSSATKKFAWRLHSRIEIDIRTTARWRGEMASHGESRGACCVSVPPRGSHIFACIWIAGLTHMNQELPCVLRSASALRGWTDHLAIAAIEAERPNYRILMSIVESCPAGRRPRNVTTSRLAGPLVARQQVDCNGTAQHLTSLPDRIPSTQGRFSWDQPTQTVPE